MSSFFRVATAAIALAATTPAYAVTVINGSFEASSPNGSFQTLGTGSSGINGWSITNGSVDLIGSYWQAAQGLNSLDMSGNTPGTIQQLISGLTVNQVYRLSFFVSANSDGGANPRLGTFSIGDQGSGISVNTAGISRPNNMLWRQQNYLFTASDVTALLSFSGDAASSVTPGGDPNLPAFGFALDNVSITAVPEPSTWAMLILGFGLVGWNLRRRTPLTRQFA